MAYIVTTSDRYDTFRRWTHSLLLWVMSDVQLYQKTTTQIRMLEVKMRNKPFKVRIVAEDHKMIDHREIVAIYTDDNGVDRLITYHNDGRFIEGQNSDLDLVITIPFYMLTQDQKEQFNLQ